MNNENPSMDQRLSGSPVQNSQNMNPGGPMGNPSNNQMASAGQQMGGQQHMGSQMEHISNMQNPGMFSGHHQVTGLNDSMP